MGAMPELLWASYAGYSDTASGGAIALRGLMKILRNAGWQCTALSGPLFDRRDGKRPAPLPLLRTLGFKPKIRTTMNIKTKHSLLEYADDDVPVTMYTCPGQPRDIEPEDAAAFVTLLRGQFAARKPDVLLTSTGPRLGTAIYDVAEEAGVPTVYWLTTAAQREITAFTRVAGTLVPSEFLRELHRKQTGSESTAIPPPIPWARVRAEDGERRYLTLINPTVAKGAAFAGRVFEALQVRSPDLPLLVVEGRGGAEALFSEGASLDRSRIDVMANTQDPRAFYKKTRVLLAPSVSPETFLMVAVEAMINGIPVVASDRGAIPETLGDAGFAYSLDDVTPWVDTIAKLWDDPAFYEEHRRKALARAEAFSWPSVSSRYETYFNQFLR